MAKASARSEQLKVLVRGASWDGDIDVFQSHEVHAQAGCIDIVFGQGSIRFAGDRYRLSLALREHHIAVDLELLPTVAPLLIQHVRLAANKPLSWMMVPRLVATGSVTVAGREHRIDGAPAYHDHNWGYFGWGDDFTWEWGTALPTPTEKWSVALVRTTDRGRFRAGLQALYLWRGGRLARILRGDELSMVHQGAVRPQAIFKVPRVMALVEPGTADRCARAGGSARRCARGRAHVVIDVVDLAQILMPDEEGLAA